MSRSIKRVGENGESRDDIGPAMIVGSNCPCMRVQATTTAIIIAATTTVAAAEWSTRRTTNAM